MLIESDIPFKSIHVYLRSSGSYVTRTKQFLEINPAGTVPVLVHNGHPIYESHEQVKYIQVRTLIVKMDLSSNFDEIILIGVFLIFPIYTSSAPLNFLQT